MKNLISVALGLAVIALGLTLMVFGLTVFASYPTQFKERTNSAAANISIKADVQKIADVKGSIDPSSGLIVDDELSLIVTNCTACHSAKLIAQNRATREGWKSMIVWMQETQNLWDLGTNEDKILDYLARHYAPERVGRRKNLENIVWYDLK